MENEFVKLPGWETVRCIGSGSSGKVYEIRRIDKYGGNFSSALKVISVPSTQEEYERMRDSMSEYALRAKLREQVEDISNEYRLLAVLKGHANIVSCEDQMIIPHDNDAGWDILIRMELLQTLPDYVHDHGITGSEVIKLGSDICSALETCRKNGIIHRDIKPQNIFVNRYGDFKLGDFGVAKSSSDNNSDKVGTYSYMAPEVYKGKGYTDSVDIYSLGLVLYWLLNERRGPFMPLPPREPTTSETADAQLRRYRGEQVPPPKNGNAALKKLVQTACSYRSEDRFGGPAEMKQALLLAAAGKLWTAQDLSSDMTVRDEGPGNVTDTVRIRETVPVQTTPRVQPKPAAVPPIQSKPQPKTPQPAPPKEKESSNTGAIVGISLVIVAMIAAIVIYFGMSRGWFERAPVESAEPTATPTESVAPTNNIADLMLSSVSLDLFEGDTGTLTVSCVPDPASGDPEPVFVWKSSDTGVATVDSTGKVTAISEGSATIRVYLSDKMDVYDECIVKVKKPTITSLTFQSKPTKTYYTVGEEIDTTGLVLLAHYSNDTDKTISDSSEYTVTYDFSTIGLKTVTVTYDGISIEYSAIVSVF